MRSSVETGIHRANRVGADGVLRQSALRHPLEAVLVARGELLRVLGQDLNDLVGASERFGADQLRQVSRQRVWQCDDREAREPASDRRGTAQRRELVARDERGRDTAPLQDQRVVETPRRAGASIRDGGDDCVAGSQLLEHLLGRRQRCRFLGTHGLKAAEPLQQHSPELVEE